MTRERSTSDPSARWPHARRLWRDHRFLLGLRIALWITIPAYFAGGFLFAWWYGPEAWIGWLFLFWEGLFVLEWLWLLPPTLILIATGHRTHALGLVCGGLIVAAVQGSVLLAVRFVGVG